MQSNNNNNKKLQIEVLRNKKNRVLVVILTETLPETKERQPAPRKADLEPREQNEEKSTTNTTTTLLPPPSPELIFFFFCF
jgi:hypothetical protein